MEAYKELSIRWEVCRSDWNDDKSKEFAQEFLEPLPEKIRTAIHHFEELDSILRRMKRDCE